MNENNKIKLPIVGTKNTGISKPTLRLALSRCVKLNGLVV